VGVIESLQHDSCLLEPRKDGRGIFSWLERIVMIARLVSTGVNGFLNKRELCRKLPLNYLVSQVDSGAGRGFGALRSPLASG
jgi:hypothetical protein